MNLLTLNDMRAATPQSWHLPDLRLGSERGEALTREQVAWLIRLRTHVDALLRAHHRSETARNPEERERASELRILALKLLLRVYFRTRDVLVSQHAATRLPSRDCSRARTSCSSGRRLHSVWRDR